MPIREWLNRHIPIGNDKVQLPVSGKVGQRQAHCICCSPLVERRFDRKQRWRRAEVAVALVQHHRQVIWGTNQSAFRSANDDIGLPIAVHVSDH